MNVLFIAPGYPDEMPLFVRGLSRHGARVFGLGDVPEAQLPELTRRHLSGYLQADIRDEAAAVETVRRAAAGRVRFDRVIALWEPGVLLAARLREALGVDGMRYDHAMLFRDKDLMKQAVAAAGIRVPYHRRATTAQEVREAVEQMGYPAIIKPIAGAGSMDTFRVDSAAELDAVIGRLGHVDVVNVEEFIDGEEFTYDTICSEGKILFEHVGYYRPRPLVARQAAGRRPPPRARRARAPAGGPAGGARGHAVSDALRVGTAFTHMEWYRKSDGEVVFGEIAARPAGARTVDLMNYNSDIDLFAGYAEAELSGTFSQQATRDYYAANVFKRAQGQGRIVRVDGVDELRRRFGSSVVNVDLLPVGAPRRDWVLTLISDGYVTVRHPDKQQLFDIADAVGTDVRLYAA